MAGVTIRNVTKAFGDLAVLRDFSQEICDRLHFGSRSFFAETFKEIAGIPPAAYREKNQKL